MAASCSEITTGLFQQRLLLLGISFKRLLAGVIVTWNFSVGNLICGNCQLSAHTTNWCPNLEHAFPTGTARQVSMLVLWLELNQVPALTQFKNI